MSRLQRPCERHLPHQGEWYWRRGAFLILVLTVAIIGLAHSGAGAQRVFTKEEVIDGLLARSGALPVEDQIYLDEIGNQNGRYDVGDVLLWLRANTDPDPDTEGGK